MIEQAAVVTRQPCNREVYKPLSQHSGKLSFNESQQSARLEKWPCRKNEKAQLSVGLQRHSSTPAGMTGSGKFTARRHDTASAFERLFPAASPGGLIRCCR
ncbi:TPA: hypothetical protein ACG5DM_000238 [Pseudomonas putida]|uniref:hypothetical protein n=1 Tax=Pseudomonas putida TaxID=303 RepID=UPI0037316984